MPKGESSRHTAGACFAPGAFSSCPSFPSAYHISFHSYFSLIMSSNNSGNRRGRGGRRDGGRGRGIGNGHRSRGRGRGRGRGDRDMPNIDKSLTPRGICHIFWSSGACDRSFDCTFKHQVRDQVVSSSAAQPTDYTPDFFSLEGLAENNGSVVDTQHTLSPSEAHNHLKFYLFDNFEFRDAIHVEGFSRILASAHSRNRTWVRRTVARNCIFFIYVTYRIPTRPRLVECPGRVLSGLIRYI